MELFGQNIFGTKYLGDVRAIATSFMVIASALGPFISGLMLDNQINLNTQFIMMSFCNVAIDNRSDLFINKY